MEKNESSGDTNKSESKPSRDEISTENPDMHSMNKMFKNLNAELVGIKTSNKSAKKEKNKDVKKEIEPVDERQVKKRTKLGLGVSKNENYSEWYSEIIIKAELIEYYDVSGCYILRPWSYSIWEAIQSWFDKQIKLMGVKNCYFPMFVSQSSLNREQTHIADFAPEVAWVTKAGQSELAEPIAIRPTSETVMYPSFAKWIQSHRDLPLRLNQWCNVVRWEFKHPTPFLRTREFLWQEGHTAHRYRKDAESEVTDILDLYKQIYVDLLAIPVIKGRKTEKEKFAGGDFTTTVEAYVPVNGRGIQGATSHHLGQNFSKMFDISYEDANKEKEFVWQNSWGISTRSIGAMIMIHGDDNGLVLPPRVARLQVIIIIVGITAKTTNEQKMELFSVGEEVLKTLKSAGIRADSDFRSYYSPGWKFNHWELKGIPLRLEIGPKDLEMKQVTCVIRHSGAKVTVKQSSLINTCKKFLDEIHDDMYEKALEARDSHLKMTSDWEEFKALLDDKFILLSPFCGQIDCEDEIKKKSTRTDAFDQAGSAAMGAKTLCIPLEQPHERLPDHCLNPECLKKPEFYVLFGRSY